MSRVDSGYEKRRGSGKSVKLRPEKVFLVLAIIKRHKYGDPVFSKVIERKANIGVGTEWVFLC